MSPSFFNATDTTPREYSAYSTGFAGYSFVTFTFGVRPVINLAPDTPITGGIGTANDPYIVG